MPRALSVDMKAVRGKVSLLPMSALCWKDPELKSTESS